MPDGFFLNIRIDAAAAGVRIPKGTPRGPGDKRGPGGQFAKAGDQGGLAAANRFIAADLQAAVVANIQGRILRRAASTNRLIKATADPQNATSSFDRIRVGNEDFLNQSTAKYWRTIEEGSAKVWSRPFIGTQLYPKGPGRPPFPVAGNQSPGLRTFKIGNEPLPWMDGSRYVVKREIAPMHAYRDAYEQLQPGRRSFEAVQKYLGDIRALPILDLS